jgi:hypothetical protein
VLCRRRRRLSPGRRVLAHEPSEGTTSPGEVFRGACNQVERGEGDLVTEKKPEPLSPAEEREAWRLVRRCDAFDVMHRALEGDRVPDNADLANAFSELRVLQEEAATHLARFKREHGIEDTTERSKS